MIICDNFDGAEQLKELFEETIESFITDSILKTLKGSHGKGFIKEYI